VRLGSKRVSAELILLGVVVGGIAIWAALGGKPISWMKYRADVAGQRIVEYVSGPYVQRIHPETEDESVAAVQGEGGYRLVEFYAEWCTSCRVQAISLEQVENDFAGRLEVISIDIDSPNAQQLKGEFAVNVVPTLVFIDPDGQEIQRFKGGTASPFLIEIIDEELPPVSEEPSE